MLKFWKKTKKDIKPLIKEELEKNRAVLESLRAYDKGEKDISTVNVQKHLRDLHTSA